MSRFLAFVLARHSSTLRKGRTMAFDPERFFTAYASAFSTGTADDIAAFYLVPCLSVRGDGSVHVFQSAGELSGFFGSVLTAYRSEGMVRFEARRATVEPLGGASARLSCDWSMQRADRSVIRAWRQTYIFQRSGDDWRIAVSLFHAGET